MGQASDKSSRIALARRHVEVGRRIVARQRQLVAADPSPAAVDLLASFERSLVIFEDDLERLLGEHDGQ